MTDKVQKIKDWIQTRKLCTMDEHMKFYCKEAESDYNLLCSIEKILDSLQEEPVSEDLEAAIDTYLATYFGGDKEKQYWPFLKKMAINFAEWQKKKDDYAIEIAHMAGEEEGKNIMKQKMMKNAVEVPIEEAVPFGSCKWKLCAKLWLDKGVKGNKVKLVIIKDE